MFVVEPHVDENVARIELAGLRGLLAVLNLRNNLGRHQDLDNGIVEFFCFFELLDVGLHLILLSGEGVKSEPLGSGGGGDGGRHA